MIRKICLLLCYLFFYSFSYGQVAGNINYQNKVRFPDNTINISLPSNADLVLSVKGLANVEADTYVAIFSITQVGKTTQEVNTLIDQRINQATKELQTLKGVEVYVDMISFVPMYELELEKKVFSKNTYNEVPVGFELKKNIHLRYMQTDQLNKLMAILSNYEVYDLVRVDYFSSNLESVKKELMNRAKLILQEKVKNYEAILGESFANQEKRLAEGYKIELPVEMYKAYEAYSSSSIVPKKSANVNAANKSTTLYYQPIIDKEFDFVINPSILAPVIQVLYEIKLGIQRKPLQTPKTSKEYYLITPSGDLKGIQLGN